MSKIAVIGGDGTGPEVVAEAIKVLRAIDTKYSLHFEFTHLPYNGTRYLQKGITLTDEELEHLKTYDAILLGAIGHTDVKPGILEKEILLKMRFALDQYINYRPIKLYKNVDSPLKNKGPEHIDYVVVRENTGGLYTGEGSITAKNSPDEVTVQKMIYTRKQVERCLKFAFETATTRRQGKAFQGLTTEQISQGFLSKLTLVGKSNVLTYTFDLWERVLATLQPQYPSVLVDYIHVDACCIYMVDSPERFDVIVTTNMFGDIITDLAAITQGGLGVAPGGNLNPEGVSMFEPIGGTAPQFTGLNQINPLAAIGAAGLMLSHLGHTQASHDVDRAIQSTILSMKQMAAGEMGMGTNDVGDCVAEYILDKSS